MEQLQAMVACVAHDERLLSRATKGRNGCRFQEAKLALPAGAQGVFIDIA